MGVNDMQTKQTVNIRWLFWLISQISVNCIVLVPLRKVTYLTKQSNLWLPRHLMVNHKPLMMYKGIIIVKSCYWCVKRGHTPDGCYSGGSIMHKKCISKVYRGGLKGVEFQVLPASLFNILYSPLHWTKCGMLWSWHQTGSVVVNILLVWVFGSHEPFSSCGCSKNGEYMYY